MKKQTYAYVKWIIAAVLVPVIIFGITTFLAQNEKMQEREAEQQQLLEEQKALELEKNRLELLAQYVGTEEYTEYYARYRMGYMSEDELIFED